MAEISLTRGDVTLRGTATGTGPTVLLLHAGGEERSVWTPIAVALSQPHLARGTGDSRRASQHQPPPATAGAAEAGTVGAAGGAEARTAGAAEVAEAEVAEAEVAEAEVAEAGTARAAGTAETRTAGVAEAPGVAGARTTEAPEARTAGAAGVAEVRTGTAAGTAAAAAGTGAEAGIAGATGAAGAAGEAGAALADGCGLRVVAFDLRGHGESSGEARELRAIADDVSAMIRREPAPVVVVGASLGGLAAIASLADPRTARAVAGLILVDVVPNPDPVRVRAWLDAHGIRDAHGELVEDIFEHSPELVATAAQLELPILLVRGGPTSPLTDAEVAHFLTINPAATVTRIPTAGHLVARDAPAELAHLIATSAATWLGHRDE